MASPPGGNIGRNLGVASGSIVINTASPEKAAASMRRVGQDIGKAMAPAKKAVEDYQKSIDQATKRGLDQLAQPAVGRNIARAMQPATAAMQEYQREIKQAERDLARLARPPRVAAVGGRGLAQLAEPVPRPPTFGPESFPSSVRVGRDIAAELEPATAAVERFQRAAEAAAQKRSLEQLAQPVAGIGRSVTQEMEQAETAVTQNIAQIQTSLERLGQARVPLSRALGPAQQATEAFADSFRQAAATAEQRGTVFTRLGNSVRGAFGTAQAAAVRFGSTLESAIRRAGQGISSLGTGIRGLQTELLAIGAGGAILAGLGLRTAASLEDAQVQLRGLAGGTQQAAELMEDLRGKADDASVPFNEMLAVATRMLPTLEGNTRELENWIPLVRRVAVLNRGEGLAGAAFAINEALSSGGTDLVSLTERFNISRVALRDALQQTGGDFAAALDLVLQRMGITQQVADEMGNTFSAALNRARDAAGQLLGAGFTPLLNALTPLLQSGADWLNQLRETNPEVATLGAGIATVAAVGAPTLVFLAQVASALEKIKALSFAGTLGRAGAAGLAVAGGVGLGIAGARAIGRQTGNEELANSTLADLTRILKQGLFVIVAALSEVVLRIAGFFTSAAEAFNKGVASMIGGMANFVRSIGEFLPDILGGDRLRDAADNLERFSQWLDENASRGSDLLADIRGRRDDALASLNRTLFPPEKASGPDDDPGGPSPDEIARRNAERTKAIVEWYDQIQQIERNRQEQRLQATAQYEAQRSQVIADFGRQAAREEEDFLRQRTRQNMQFQRDVERITRERVKREADWLNDLNKRIAQMTAETGSRISSIRNEGGERIAEIRQEGNERLIQLEEDYQRQREQAQAEHRNRLLEAAARLDASAVANEQRRFNTATSQAAQEQAVRLEREREGLEKRIQAEQEGIQKRIEQEQAGLEERIQQEREAHAERVAEARAADVERINDMREALRLQQQMEDEDRAIRLQRTEEDHQRQLAALQKANTERLQEINRAAIQERAELNKKFQAELADLGEASTSYLRIQREKEEAALKLFDQYWQDWNDTIERQRPPAPTAVPEFQTGGLASFTGLAQLHGTQARPEMVLSQDTTAALRSMLGNFNQAQLVGAIAGGAGGRNVSVGSITIPIHAAAGQDAGDIAAAVRVELASFFESVTK